MDEFKKLNETFNKFWESLNGEEVENKKEKINAVKAKLINWRLEIETLWSLEDPIGAMWNNENELSRNDAKSLQDLLFYYSLIRFFTGPLEEASQAPEPPQRF